MNTHITKDGFIWKMLTSEEAKAIFNIGLFELYEVNTEDDSETLIETFDDLILAMKGGSIGIEVGSIGDSNSVINHVELASELAEEKLNSYADGLNQYDHEQEFPNGIYVETEDETSYTEEAQEKFNELYDYYLNKIENTKI